MLNVEIVKIVEGVQRVEKVEGVQRVEEALVIPNNVRDLVARLTRCECH